MGLYKKYRLIAQIRPDYWGGYEFDTLEDLYAIKAVNNLLPGILELNLIRNDNLIMHLTDNTIRSIGRISSMDDDEYLAMQSMKKLKSDLDRCRLAVVFENSLGKSWFSKPYDIIAVTSNE